MEDSLAYIVGRFSGGLIGELLTTVLQVLFLFFFFSLPFRLVIRFCKNYKVNIICRNISYGILITLIIFCLSSTMSSSNIYMSEILQDDTKNLMVIMAIAQLSMLWLLPLYYIVCDLVGKVDFFDRKHTKYLKYFILYMRSFNDEKKSDRKKEKKLMQSLGKLFKPFAIGCPDEFLPPKHGATRLYVGQEWKEVVIELMAKAPIILLRTSTSENFLWEFDQCMQNGYLDKVIFWVSNAGTKKCDYDQFRSIAQEKYGIDMPEITVFKEGIDVVLFKKADGSFRIYTLLMDDDYNRLADTYTREHQAMLVPLEDYLSGKSRIKSHILGNTRDRILPEGIQRWSWSAFLFPAFFVITHPIKHRFLLYFLLISMPFLSIIVDWRISVLYLIAMFIFGRDGRAISWLSHPWESVEYFLYNARRSNYIVWAFGLLCTAGFLGFWGISWLYQNGYLDMALQAAE